MHNRLQAGDGCGECGQLEQGEDCALGVGSLNEAARCGILEPEKGERSVSTWGHPGKGSNHLNRTLGAGEGVATDKGDSLRALIKHVIILKTMGVKTSRWSGG